MCVCTGKDVSGDQWLDVDRMLATVMPGQPAYLRNLGYVYFSCGLRLLFCVHQRAGYISTSAEP